MDCRNRGRVASLSRGPLDTGKKPILSFASDWSIGGVACCTTLKVAADFPTPAASDNLANFSKIDRKIRRNTDLKSQRVAKRLEPSGFWGAKSPIRYPTDLY